VLLGITGGVAAHKSVDLASKLVQQGARVDVLLTESALQFVGPSGLQAITRRPVHGSVFEPWTESYAGHITLGEESDLIIVAPATAHVIAELAAGLAPDMLGAAVLASSAPLLIAPAMEDSMYRHPATHQNLETLRQRGALLIGPESGRLAWVNSASAACPSRPRSLVPPAWRWDGRGCCVASASSLPPGALARRSIRFAIWAIVRAV
jgi:phosphopantothenoylcysteine decarboxylase/phosphopantothenate--cysteine ligase